MHTFGEVGAGVPAFLAKLWRLVEDPQTNNLISWNKDGRSFIIQNQVQFARELLPLNYKHNNLASFIRQLNMYGFHKITSIDNGGLKFDRDEMEFSHPCFKRNCPHLLEHIKRKIATARGGEEKTTPKQTEIASKVLQDVKAVRGRQESLDSRFMVMKQENEALWREVASLRQKHAKQQQIVNKLIQFLITIVQPQRNMTSVKRHMQLMINDTPANRTRSESDTDAGPVIHELSEELLEEVDDDSEDELIDPQILTRKMTGEEQDDENTLTFSNVEQRPRSSASSYSQNLDYSNQSNEDALLTGVFDDNGTNSGTITVSPSGAHIIMPPNAGGANVTHAGLKGHINAAPTIIQSVGSDGNEVIYHVTEVPDSHPAEIPQNFNDDNVLTTPMVREEMARKQQLKEKNKQTNKRRKQTTKPSDVPDDTADDEVKKQRLWKPISKQSELSNESQQSKPDSQIEIENNANAGGSVYNPALFLNTYTRDTINSPNAALMSPLINEDSNLSHGSIGQNIHTLNTVASPTIDNTNRVMYDTDNFLDNDMPDNIFEDSNLSLTEDNNFSSENGKLAQPQQIELPTSTSGKFSEFRNVNRPSTSAEALASTAVNNASPTVEDDTNGATTSAQAAKNDRNLAITKYNKDNTRQDVDRHLDAVQDDLEYFKDLLRGENCSLDANTLMGLFSDADLLGNNYGLSMNMPTESTNDKTGSELMACQPMYDFSDIMDMNDNSNFGDDDISSTNDEQKPPFSVLNTPQHEDSKWIPPSTRSKTNLI